MPARLVEAALLTKRPSPWRRWLEHSASASVDLLFPPRCAACAAACEPVSGGPLLCAECEEALAIATRPTCLRCGLTCSEADLPRGNCGNCRSQKLLFTAVRTVGSYRDALRQAVLKAKHAAYEPLAIALGQRLAEAVRRLPFQQRPDVVVPVPMHWLKRVWRKTNSADTMARSLARQLELPLVSALVCRRYMRRQATLTPAERRRNVRGAFRTSWWWKLTGKRVLLVDDVMTTGATAHEASSVLLKSGAAAVYVATASRSSPDF